jgi:hypothetical protein
MSGGKLLWTDDPKMLADYLAAIPSGLVVLDGFPAAGKSTLTRGMANDLCREYVDVDCFLTQKLGIFVGAVKYDDLTKRIDEAFLKSAVVLLASLCAKDVVERTGFTNVTFVYVYHDKTGGDFKDPDEATGAAIPEDFPLYHEVIEYHRRRRPFRNSDIVFIRRDLATSEGALANEWDKFLTGIPSKRGAVGS